MENVRSTRLPGKYHDAITRWQETFLPDLPLLEENWEKFFPRDPKFQLCAYRQCDMCGVIEVGKEQGKPKYQKATDMTEEQAGHLLKAIQAQASTEFGSIQQHQLTLARAQDEQDQFWALRVMAEELRHGYQMCHLLLEDDWKAVAPESGEQMVEEILSMRTGSHVLGAFNIDFDSFLDNIVFCALIDRVGKFQLAMQKVSAYQPMAESMPPMLVEEAFHLTAGVVPMRRWVSQAAKGKGFITMDAIQRALNKWFPRALDMFGDERGGGSNVKMGFKPMKNDEAMGKYIEEMEGIVRTLNVRYVRDRLPKLPREDAYALLDRVMESGDPEQGVRREDLLALPDKTFLRRRGIWAYEMRDTTGAEIKDVEQYKRTLYKTLPDAYPQGRDFKDYLRLVREVAAGTTTKEHAVGQMPELSRVGGVCPCARAVRWVVDGNGNGAH